MQTDGNLVLVNYSVNPPESLWATNTFNTDGNVAYMQSDGNFVLYGADGHALWSTNTAGARAGTSLEIEDNGNMVILEFGVVLWQTNTGGH